MWVFFLSYFPPAPRPSKPRLRITPFRALSEALSFIIPNLRDCPEAYPSPFFHEERMKAYVGGVLWQGWWGAFLCFPDLPCVSEKSPPIKY